VTATTSNQDKVDFLRSLPNGPTHVINYKTQDFAEEVKNVTNGKGVDVIIDFVGQSHWQKNIDALAVDGRMTILSVLSGNVVPAVDLAPVLFKRLRIQGSTLRSRSVGYQANLIEKFSREILPKITGSEGEGPIRTYIHKVSNSTLCGRCPSTLCNMKVYPWTDIQSAHNEMEQNKNSGKIIAEVV
jgi:NADPH:quinone reductase-like Zn-dependent oxidoreductase